MNQTETASLLTLVSGFDRRSLNEADVVLWQKALHDVDFEPAREAVVQHYRTNTDWLMPAHVRNLVLSKQQDAAMRALAPTRSDLVPMPPWFKDLYRETLAAERAKGTYTERGNLGSVIDDLAGGWT